MFLWGGLIVLFLAIIMGARVGGLGLGVMGGLGLAILTFVFGYQPSAPPIDVMLMIVAVVTAAGALQAAGGLDYLVSIAEGLLRKNPQQITILGPLVTYLFTLVSGTGHVSYAILPVISEVALETKVRPERPLSIAVIASQQAITASPISAATVALLGLLSPQGIQLFDILKICIPATLTGVVVGALFSARMGVELDKDPEYQRRVAEGLIKPRKIDADASYSFKTKLSVYVFVLAAVCVVLLGSFPELRPTWEVAGKVRELSMPHAIEIVMLSAAAFIILFCGCDVKKLANGSVFIAGMQAVIAIFGIAWMGDTYFAANLAVIKPAIESVVTLYPWTFAIALFFLSVLLYSQAATIRAFGPLGVALGLPAGALIAMFPAVNGYFFIPNYPTLVAAINFDRTGTTRIGRYILNHSFQLPGFVATIVAIVTGFVLSSFLL